MIKLDMICFCAKRNRIRSGAIEKVDADMRRAVLEDASCAKYESPTCNTRILSLLVITRGHIKLFQLPMREKIAVVASIGLEMGNMILHKISKREHPSITAASKRS